MSDALVTRPATMRDAEELAPRLRVGDRAALCAAVPGVDLARLLGAAVEASDVPHAFVRGGGGVEGLAGLTPLDDREALIWVAGSDSLLHPLREFASACRAILDEHLRDRERLLSRVHHGDASIERWHVWLGFRPVSQSDPVHDLLLSRPTAALMEIRRW